MSKASIYEAKTESLILPILDRMNFELIDVEFVKEAGTMYLRAYIDKEGGIMIDDCVDVSHELSDLLDEYDYIDDEYILEVSSPGLGRALKRDRDFEKSIGREIDIKLYKAVNKEKEFTGILKAYDKEKIIATIDDEDREYLRSDLASIKLHVEF